MCPLSILYGRFLKYRCAVYFRSPEAAHATSPQRLRARAAKTITKGSDPMFGKSSLERNQLIL